MSESGRIPRDAKLHVNGDVVISWAGVNGSVYSYIRPKYAGASVKWVQIIMNGIEIYIWSL